MSKTFLTTHEKISEYEVEHPRWNVYPVRDYRIDVDFAKVYGPDFGFLTQQKPLAVCLAEGSETRQADLKNMRHILNR